MTVALVGAGPGSAELLTLKAARLLEEAEVVVFDRLDQVLYMRKSLGGDEAELCHVRAQRVDHHERAGGDGDPEAGGIKPFQPHEAPQRRRHGARIREGLG